MISKYENPNITLISRLKEDQPLSDEEFVESLIAASLYAEDRDWVKDTVTRIINEKHNRKITSAALKALGHIARIDKNVSIYELNTIPRNILDNAIYSSLIEDLKDDITVFNQ